MNVYLRDKLLQKLESLSDERGYQVMDYVEFLESKYAERPAPSSETPNPLLRFADAVEEKLRAGKVSASTIAETMGFMGKAMGVLNGAAAAGKSVANDFLTSANRVVDAATSAAKPPAGSTPGTSGASGAGTPGAGQNPTSGAAGDINPS